MKMASDCNTAAAPMRTRYGKVRLRSLDELDGRTAAAQRAASLVAGLEADLGGKDSLSVGMHELVKRVALVGALCEDAEVCWLEGKPIDVGHYALLANAQRRLLLTLGLDRRPRDVTDYDDNDEIGLEVERQLSGAQP
jgi:hypothetical protein